MYDNDDRHWFRYLNPSMDCRHLPEIRDLVHLTHMAFEQVGLVELSMIFCACKPDHAVEWHRTVSRGNLLGILGSEQSLWAGDYLIFYDAVLIYGH